mmetsp:Transcript_40359/g.85939  ORF Transcript_40359/g.85939 Transcript_40359/m.85939 type:complete len:349 (+) Transcript_40359:446-1492(+)
MARHPPLYLYSLVPHLVNSSFSSVDIFQGRPICLLSDTTRPKSSGQGGQLGVILHVPFREVVRDIQIGHLRPLLLDSPSLVPPGVPGSLVHLVPQRELPRVVDDELTTPVHHVRVRYALVRVAKPEGAPSAGGAEAPPAGRAREPVSPVAVGAFRSGEPRGRGEEHPRPGAGLDAQDLVDPPVETARLGRRVHNVIEHLSTEPQGIVRFSPVAVDGPLHGSVNGGHGPGGRHPSRRRHLHRLDLPPVVVHDARRRRNLGVAERPPDVRIRPGQELRHEPVGERSRRPQGFEPRHTVDAGHAGGGDGFREADVNFVGYSQGTECLLAQIPPDRPTLRVSELDQRALVKS